MKILIHTAASPYGKSPVGGAETSLRLLAEKFASLGHTVYFVAKGDARSSKVVRKDIIKGVNVITFRKFLNPLKLYAIDKWSIAYCNFYLERILKRENVEIVHTYYNLSLCEPYLDRLRSGSFQFKLIVRIAGMRWLEQIKSNPELQQQYEVLFSEADALNFISEGLLTLFRQGLGTLDMPFSPKHYFVKDIGVSLKSITATSLTKEQETFNCLMVSRFTDYQKRQDILINAMALLPQETPIRLKLIGNGPKMDALNNRIMELGLKEKVVIQPFMPQQELWSEMAQSDLICHACEYEGLSKIIIESMAMAKSVLVSNVLPLNNYIVDGDTGFLVENTPKAWASKLLGLLQDKQELIFVGAKAAAFVKSEFDAEKNIKRYVQEFSELIDLNKTTDSVS